MMVHYSFTNTGQVKILLKLRFLTKRFTEEELWELL